MGKKICAAVVMSAALFFTGCGETASDSAAQTSAASETRYVSAENSVEESFSADAGVQDETVQSSTVQSGASGLANEETLLEDNFTPICQYPELPTGCEVTSLTMVLNYCGFEVDKCDIADNFLVKGDVGSVNFNLAFVGDPRDSSSYGCYAPVIVNAAESYLEREQSNLSVQNLTGTELEELFAYIDLKKPVIIWGTRDCVQGHYSVTWNVDGEDLTWFTPEHCMVLVGYDDVNARVADPIYGDIRSYDVQTLKSSYDSLGKQAILIS